MMSDLNKSHGKFSDFVLFTLFGFTLVKKPEKKKTFFLSKNDVRFEYVLSKGAWFGLSFVVWVEYCQ